MTQAVKNRFKSFAWRTAIMTLAFGANYMVTYVSDAGLPPTMTILIGLVLGEVSKYLNTEVEIVEKKETQKVATKKIAKKIKK